jgi:hypothetical protein
MEIEVVGTERNLMFGECGSFFDDDYKGTKDKYAIDLYLLVELSYLLILHVIAIYWRHFLDMLGRMTLRD